jgi:tRNA A-37 threonylcarbamoyl transferase component Bud32
VSTPEVRLRTPSVALLNLPWDVPLADWDPATVPLRRIAVGPSRHLVRFVVADGVLWALKELPVRIAGKEYEALRRMEAMGLPTVKAAGLVVRSVPEDSAVLVTRYLTGSWQYRRLFARLPPDRAAHRARLLDAMAGLLVELHRHGVYWGDCSLANTLFSRDGQALQAHLVDAETAEIHPSLSDGQRQMDLDILVENVASGLIDVAASLGRPPEIEPRLIEEALGVPERYRALWDALHAEPRFAFSDRYRVESTVRDLEELGFVVDEVSLVPDGDGVRLRVGVGDRRFHAQRLRELTGLDVGEGQARELLADLQAHRGALSREQGRAVSEDEAAASWRHDVLAPGMRRAHAAVGHVGTAVQAWCDLLEVRWLLSEAAGHDVGTAAAMEALAEKAPTDSAARALVADVAPPGEQ